MRDIQSDIEICANYVRSYARPYSLSFLILRKGMPSNIILGSVVREGLRTGNGQARIGL